jgi:hypothetical protein
MTGELVEEIGESGNSCQGKPDDAAPENSMLCSSPILKPALLDSVADESSPALET